MGIRNIQRIDHRPRKNEREPSLSLTTVVSFSNLGEPTCAADGTITSDFYRRTPRSTDPTVELAAMKHLAQFLTAEPSVILDQLTEVLVRACNAGSAGVTLDERRDLSGKLSRVSGAGDFNPRPHQRISRHSPCGIVIELQRTEIFQRPERLYPSLRHNSLRFEELVVVPWQVPDGRVGTVWIASHHPTRRFDPEDLRLIESLAQFAKLAMQRSGSEESRRSHAALKSAARLANELAHEINNPLQALVNSLYLVPNSFDNEHLLQVSAQAKRLTEAVQSVLQIKRADEPR